MDEDKNLQNNYLINYKPPTLEVKSCISILISADFLVMKDLVDETLQYLAHNLSDIVKLPIDMNCINDWLIKALSLKTHVEAID